MKYNPLSFLTTILERRKLVYSMARREVSSKYVGSAFGIVWAVAQPLVMISVFWFIFSIGFRVSPRNDVPFVVWLAAGMAPWFAFADIMNLATSAVISNGNLIKKTFFPSEILPVIRAVSGLFSHLIFVTIVLCLIGLMQMEISFYFFQSLYYLCCLFFLALGLSWTFASLTVFLRDIRHMVAIVMQVGFWATPIFWDINMMSGTVQKILKLNPVYYIIQGYRESFIYFTPFWHHPVYTLYFWGVTSLLFLGGMFVFARLKPQFPDVL